MRVFRRGDAYPSRVADTPSITRRLDPVVYGDVAGRSGGALGPRELRHYEENGFLFMERLFSRGEVEAFRADLEDLRASEAVRKSPAVILEPESGEARSIFYVHRTSRAFSDLAWDRRLVGIAAQLLDSAVYVHQSRINLKPGFEGKEFYWHSDFETWHVEDGMPRMRAVSFSIALTENTPFNGPLMVIPGSHHSFVSCVGATPEDHYRDSLRRQEVGVPDRESLRRLTEEGGIAAPTGPAGSVLLFECNLQHGSNSNISPWPRSNVFLVYNSVENRLVEPFCGLRPRPEFIASRDFTPVTPAEAEHGHFAQV
ncbi:MAG: ectoine hydroxylase [Candidatus Handelsmanbacteria bacterium RIFCSPLOWO2_12_FULL_64_10]|uniref:Ectoine hydroxylase n=1 Tax=Handelsmanbacteria sp. (strain RIFCSPLOWO2_12_FULL_64_10) TaxID=1817868 RepID=A0A1F6D412_HANXR|nr:MAG: ectoine hydroxylase [Candidatus Handelsmanbacteria bacterium RIFCSPLOWO2_12_FULL_64_10]